MLFCARLYGANNVSNGNNVIISAICKCTEGGCTHVMHGRSRITIDPRIPTMPRQSTSGGVGGVLMSCMAVVL